LSKNIVFLKNCLVLSMLIAVIRIW